MLSDLRISINSIFFQDQKKIQSKFYLFIFFDFDLDPC